LKTTDMVAIMKEVIQLYEHSYPRIDFYFDTPESPVCVLGDAAQLKRVFVNIYTNAIAAVKNVENPRISLHVYQAVGMVKVSLKDEGSGIPLGLHGKVLEPYFSTKEEGSGLGLAIVQQIVRDHDGRVWLERNKPRGTVVYLEFPGVADSALEEEGHATV
ncbi:MAG: HAMP domain-containing sensor histidine kinase, partial [Zetaproteobacteria bacterium]|nr:HAMP domain-containing sensor histidine kinase [Zetaproteobacteria bacterium]